MLATLQKIESNMPTLLADDRAWMSLFVDYHAPFVERLWRDHEGLRICLHRIHPCTREEALFHPHPWPSAMRVIAGTYEMTLGFGEGMQEPPVAATLILREESLYEMIHPDGWHSVRPLGAPSLSLMVSGKPWDRPSHKSDKILGPITDAARIEILGQFRKRYSA